MRWLARLLVVVVSASSLAWVATPARAAGCQFTFGFKTLHDLIPAIVGDCKGDETYNAITGDGLQVTNGVNGAGGLLVWRKADNWTAYTDGYHTWINGPNGLHERLNTDRFPWEADYMSRDALQLSDLPPGYAVNASATGPFTNEMLIQHSPDPATTRTRIQQWGRIGGYVVVFNWPQPTIRNGQLGWIQNIVDNFASVQGAMAQTSIAGWSQPLPGWLPISAPTIGDESAAFTTSQVMDLGGQTALSTMFDIHFRVGNVIASIDTAELGPTANVSQAVVLARIVAARIRAHQ